MHSKEGSAFTYPIRNGNLLHVAPPVLHRRALVSGGLKYLIGDVQNKHKIKQKHEPGAFTKEDGSFCVQSGMPWLAARFRILEVIGKGQSSVVLKAQDMFQSNAFVALKVLHSHYNLLGTQETDFIRRLNQADPQNTTATLRLITTFQFDSHYCLVFELLHQAPLVDVVISATSRLSPRGAAPGGKSCCLPIIRQLARQLLKALGFLRQQNIIHADLKPSNLLLSDASDFNSVKVVDFGNAIHCVHDELSLYYDDFELQTLLYRAPEVIFGVPFGLEVDMWSFGCILAELYLQDRLFTGKNKTAVIQQMVNLLGPLPTPVFQRGKFYSLLQSYCAKTEQKDATQDLLNRLGCNDYAFANFLAGCLRFNPNERMSISAAAFHPFLAQELGLSYILHGETALCARNMTSMPSGYHHSPSITSNQSAARLDLLRHGTGDLLTSLQPQSLIAPVTSFPMMPQSRTIRQVAQVVPLKRGKSPPLPLPMLPPTLRRGVDQPPAPVTNAAQEVTVVVASTSDQQDIDRQHPVASSNTAGSGRRVQSEPETQLEERSLYFEHHEDSNVSGLVMDLPLPEKTDDKEQSRVPCRRSLHKDPSFNVLRPPESSSQAIDLRLANQQAQMLASDNQAQLLGDRQKDKIHRPKPDGGIRINNLPLARSRREIGKNVSALRSTVQAIVKEQDQVEPHYESSDEEADQTYWDSGNWDTTRKDVGVKSPEKKKVAIPTPIIPPSDMGHKIRRKLSSLSKSSFSSTHSMSDLDSGAEDEQVSRSGTKSHVSHRQYVIENTPWIQERLSKFIYKGEKRRPEETASGGSQMNIDPEMKTEKTDAVKDEDSGRRNENKKELRREVVQEKSSMDACGQVTKSESVVVYQDGKSYGRVPIARTDSSSSVKDMGKKSCDSLDTKIAMTSVTKLQEKGDTDMPKGSKVLTFKKSVETDRKERFDDVRIEERSATSGLLVPQRNKSSELRADGVNLVQGITRVKEMMPSATCMQGKVAKCSAAKGAASRSVSPHVSRPSSRSAQDSAMNDDVDVDVLEKSELDVTFLSLPSKKGKATWKSTAKKESKSATPKAHTSRNTATKRKRETLSISNNVKKGELDNMTKQKDSDVNKSDKVSPMKVYDFCESPLESKRSKGDQVSQRPKAKQAGTKAAGLKRKRNEGNLQKSTKRGKAEAAPQCQNTAPNTPVSSPITVVMSPSSPLSDCSLASGYASPPALIPQAAIISPSSSTSASSSSCSKSSTTTMRNQGKKLSTASSVSSTASKKSHLNDKQQQQQQKQLPQTRKLPAGKTSGGGGVPGKKRRKVGKDGNSAGRALNCLQVVNDDPEKGLLDTDRWLNESSSSDDEELFMFSALAAREKTRSPVVSDSGKKTKASGSATKKMIQPQKPVSKSSAENARQKVDQSSRQKKPVVPSSGSTCKRAQPKRTPKATVSSKQQSSQKKTRTAKREINYNEDDHQVSQEEDKEWTDRSEANSSTSSVDEIMLV